MGNVNMESHQIHYKGEETAKTMFEKLDLIAQQVGDLPTFTSDDRAFLEKLPALPKAEGKTVLTAETDDQGETNLSYAAPEVEGEDVAPEFSDAEAYSAGDLVFHDGILYKFSSDHAAGDWDATEATPTSVAGELSELKNTITNVGNMRMTKLWENPDATQAMPANTEINVNTAGYDFVMITCIYSTNYSQYKNNIIIPHGASTSLMMPSADASSFVTRNFNYVSDIKYQSGIPYNAVTVTDNVAIPTAIYGIKLT